MGCTDRVNKSEDSCSQVGLRHSFMCTAGLCISSVDPLLSFPGSHTQTYTWPWSLLSFTLLQSTSCYILGFAQTHIAELLYTSWVREKEVLLGYVGRISRELLSDTPGRKGWGGI
uniref:Uncharacterized protein n=1 Tax=Sphaerodactylus townsendi TaxID=933632 RepID=A0ACB8G8U6_9SAUR